MSINNPYGYYKQDDEEPKKKKKCKFILDPETSTVCDVETDNDMEYCCVHRAIKCNCGVQATHFCHYCLRGKKGFPICSNSFCKANHNINMKHIKTVYQR